MNFGMGRPSALVGVRVDAKQQRASQELDGQLAAQRRDLLDLARDRMFPAWSFRAIARRALEVANDPRAEKGEGAVAESARSLVIEVASEAAKFIERDLRGAPTQTNISQRLRATANAWSLVRGGGGSDIDEVATCLRAVASGGTSNAPAARELIAKVAKRAAEHDEAAWEAVGLVRSDLPLAERVALTSIEPSRIDTEIARELLSYAAHAIEGGDGRFAGALLATIKAGIDVPNGRFNARAKAVFADELKMLSAKAETAARDQKISLASFAAA